MKVGAIAVSNTADVYVMDGSKVFVENAGELIMERSSHIIVEDGGEVTLSSGGLYQTHGDSETYVKEGGVFRVKSDGILRLVDESRLLVEPGGQLILEEGAVVQLWDNAQPDGRANVHIQGELVINGDFSFDGTGFFQFDAGNVLTLAAGADFKLMGAGQGTRFIRMNKNAKLDIGSHTIRLSDGEVEYERGSSINLGEEGTALFTDVDFTDLNMPGEADALLAHTSPRMITVGGCTFSNLVTGISAHNILGTPITGSYSRFLRVTDSEFIGCEIDIAVSNTPSVEIIGTDFTANPDQSLYGLYLQWVGNAYVQNCHLSGYADANAGAVYLYDVPDYNMVGGTVSGNVVGIRATGQSNVDMSSGATVSANTTGIEMDGGLSFGVLTMDCSKLLDNTVGVFGADVMLNIDASGELKPNHFSTTFGNPLFKICYDQLSGIIGNEIEAKDNFWEGDIYYLLYNQGQPGFVTCNYFTGNVNLLIDPQAPDPSCNSGGPNPVPNPDIADTNFTGGDPNCLDDSQHILYDTYWDAYDAYLQETYDEVNDRPLSDSLYNEVASVPDNVNQHYIKKCQQLIHIARSRVEASSGLNTYGGNANDQLENQSWEGNNKRLKIFPNPTKGAFSIQLKPGEYRIKVFNVFGMPIFQTSAWGSAQIATNDWGQGLYFVEIYDKKNNERISSKISVNK